MHITFRPDKKHESFLNSLAGKGKRSEWINNAIDFYLTFQPTQAKQTQLLESLLENQRQLIGQIESLHKQIEELRAKGLVADLKQSIENSAAQEDSQEDEAFYNLLMSGLSKKTSI
ncbi:hypothetical protein L1765_11125 [Microaerobacter geothermalis]|uniref:hypothetical protein n=1 Tax=Microaerobacter geothermalis TaxID=674972 RepID=UPI001F3A2FFD|nr:hypothetical protein [Microaerobacter geothermalis]MCF6094515.1 hypothetical protein [Microaerobacter geothermalis]